MKDKTKIILIVSVFLIVLGSVIYLAIVSNSNKFKDNKEVEQLTLFLKAVEYNNISNSLNANYIVGYYTEINGFKAFNKLKEGTLEKDKWTVINYPIDKNFYWYVKKEGYGNVKGVAPLIYSQNRNFTSLTNNTQIVLELPKYGSLNITSEDCLKEGDGILKLNIQMYNGQYYPRPRICLKPSVSILNALIDIVREECEVKWDNCQEYEKGGETNLSANEKCRIRFTADSYKCSNRIVKLCASLENNGKTCIAKSPALPKRLSDYKGCFATNIASFDNNTIEIKYKGTSTISSTDFLKIAVFDINIESEKEPPQYIFEDPDGKDTGAKDFFYEFKKC